MFSAQDTGSAAAEEANDRDVVLIKEETAKEDSNDNDATEELLLHEEGKRTEKAVASRARK